MNGVFLLRDYWRSLFHPEFWVYATWLDLVTKYRRSKLGLIWALVPSVLYTFGIGTFYAFFAHMPPTHFFAYIGVGYVIYRLITAPMNECCGTFRAHVNFILDGQIRFTDYVLRVIAKALFYFIMSLPVMVIALALNPNFHLEGLFTLVPALAVVLLNVAWIGVVVAIMGARLPDMHELVGSILMFAFLFTPILWRADNVPASSVRGIIARLNPLYHLVEIVRAPLLGVSVERFTLVYVLVMTVVGWTVAGLLYRRYARFVPIWI